MPVRQQQVIRSGKGGSVLDYRIPTRSLESKSIDLTRRSYGTKGVLNQANVTQAIARHLKQAAKHMNAMQRLGMTNQRMGGPLKETVVYSVKADSRGQVDTFREIARREGNRTGIKVGVTGTPMTFDPKPTGSPGFAGVLASIARKPLAAAMGWDLEAREQYGIFGMSREQRAQLDRERASAQSGRFYEKLSQVYSRNGFTITAQELKRRIEAQRQRPSSSQPTIGPARSDAERWIFP